MRNKYVLSLLPLSMYIMENIISMKEICLYNFNLFRPMCIVYLVHLRYGFFSVLVCISISSHSHHNNTFFVNLRILRTKILNCFCVASFPAFALDLKISNIFNGRISKQFYLLAELKRQLLFPFIFNKL